MKNLMNILILILISTEPTFALAGLSCRRLFTNTEVPTARPAAPQKIQTDNINNFLNDLNSIAQNGFWISRIGSTRNAREMLVESVPFNQFLREKGSNSKAFSRLSEVQQTKIIGEYLYQKILEISGDNLHREQDKSYNNVLETRVRKLTNNSGRNNLEKISMKNLSEYTTKYEASIRLAESNIKFKKVQEWFDKLDFYFFHNRALKVSNDLNMPLMSTRVLREIGLDIGLTNLAFNRWLKSDESVYFHVDIKFKNTDKIAQESEYGKNTLLIKDDYAVENGWVSTFVMYPDELVRSIGYSLHPKETDKYLTRFGSLLKRKHPNDADWKSNFESNPDFWNTLRQSQGQLDFTVRDYKEFVRLVFLGEVSLLLEKDKKEFHEAYVEILSAEHPMSAIRNFGFNPANLPSYWEFKVQTAVPETAIEIIR
ncbi:MAG: hypothetical protein V4596_03635 [Bdellovibrionota bacterium]